MAYLPNTLILHDLLSELGSSKVMTVRPVAGLLKAETETLDRTVCCFLHSYS